ncbi:hypothetical protein B0H10DRAFT_2052356 [Mycena sp. CBHHK59/15]|nr:hypothetical protein B0H10DRAFT_2052356 [Mycena sp. CBHHK59/15]
MHRATAESTFPFTSISGIASSVIVPQGTTLFVGITGANRLKSAWGADAENWKAERKVQGATCEWMLNNEEMYKCSV